jgi:GTP pyrophosphokinase
MKDSEITFEGLLKEIKTSDKEVLDKIREAYEFAKIEHEGQKRLTGDDYITHPLHVAEILTTLNVDDTTIISALLHEVLNNGNTATKELLEEKFGSEVANIVDSISRINKLELLDETESSAIYLRKVLVGLAEDPRVLYIKLADRLHNMRTNWAIKKEKQKEKAKETMAVLVPIAHRLGINSIKSELEDICLKVLKPDVYNDIVEKLDKTKSELNDNLMQMKDDLNELLDENGINHEIKGRVKSVYSIYNKLHNGKKWSEIYDILALRIFVNTETECYTTIGLIHSKYRPLPRRFKDYIANPKENMYQSLHTTVFGSDGEVYEVQVRTYEMDEIAEKGIASHWSYKEHGTKKVQAIMEQKLEMFRNIIETNENEDAASLENVINNDILSELIYVFTPKGDVIELPKDSTPIDFAYRIHSGVGDKTVGAIVNDNIVSLSYNLQNNDIVKIITNNNATPNADWLNFVKTSQARAKIKSYFSKKDREEMLLKGKSILEKEIRKRKLNISDVLSDNNVNKVLKDLKLDDLDDLYLQIGSLRYTAGYIINLTMDDKHNVEDALMERIKPVFNINNKDDIIVAGNTNIMYSLALCCKPVKGDEIVGYITKGEGVTVHKKNCKNVKNSPNRLIDVAWNDNSDNYYLTDITLLVSNNNFLM